MYVYLIFPNDCSIPEFQLLLMRVPNSARGFAGKLVVGQIHSNSNSKSKRNPLSKMNSTNTTSANQAKERLYAQLASSLGRMSRAISQTADLCEQLQVDLHAMRVLAGLDAAK